MVVVVQQDSTDPAPMLRNILTAVTTCNSSIAHLTGKVKGMNVEISLLRQDMQKLKERTSGLRASLVPWKMTGNPCKEMTDM